MTSLKKYSDLHYMEYTLIINLALVLEYRTFDPNNMNCLEELHIKSILVRKFRKKRTLKNDQYHPKRYGPLCIKGQSIH